MTIQAIGCDGHPTIQGAWPGWPEEFASGIDCAFYGAGTESETIYFLKGDQFVTYNLDVDRVTSEPRPIISKWPKLAPYFRRPQLFLVESYHLTTYYGDITPGPLQSSQVLQGGAEETYTVIIKRSSSQTISDTMTVLESQDQTLVDLSMQSMQDESAEGRQTESYDYQFDSSFEGEIELYWLGWGCERSAQFPGRLERCASVRFKGIEECHPEANREDGTKPPADGARCQWHLQYDG